MIVSLFLYSDHIWPYHSPGKWYYFSAPDISKSTFTFHKFVLRKLISKVRFASFCWEIHWESCGMRNYLCLAAFESVSLSLIYQSDYMSQCDSLWIYPCWRFFLAFLLCQFLSSNSASFWPIVLQINFFPILSFSSGIPIIHMLAHLIVPYKSRRLSSSLSLICFICAPDLMISATCCRVHWFFLPPGNFDVDVES